MNPTKELRQYQIQTVHGNFSIWTNQDKNTLEACLINWEARHELKDLKQMKQSLIDYINSKRWAGFVAFANKKQAENEIKEL